jgi:hypothetical protein
VVLPRTKEVVLGVGGGGACSLGWFYIYAQSNCLSTVSVLSDTSLPAAPFLFVFLRVDTQARSAVPRALNGKLVVQGGLSTSLFILRRVLSRINSLLRGVDVMRHDGNIVLLEQSVSILNLGGESMTSSWSPLAGLTVALYPMVLDSKANSFEM